MNKYGCFTCFFLYIFLSRAVNKQANDQNDIPVAIDKLVSFKLLFTICVFVCIAWCQELKFTDNNSINVSAALHYCSVCYLFMTETGPLVVYDGLPQSYKLLYLL